MRPFRVPAFALGLFAVACAASSDDPKLPAPTVQELVADLGHPVFSVREKAHRELWARGDEAIPALEKVLNDDNPEVVRRARELLDKFAWGIRPDTPPAVLKVLRQFQAGDKDPRRSAEVRRDAILELLRLGPPGVSVARALLGKPLPDEARAQVVAQVTALLRREVPLRLFEGKDAEAAELIALHAAGSGPEGAADYAVFQILRGNLPAAIATAETSLKTGKQAAAHKLTLAHLYRASGDWAKARDMAADIPRSPNGFSLTQLLREEEGDWAHLADNFPTAGTNHPEALRLTLVRLAGRRQAFDEEADKLIKAATEFAGANETFDAVIALLANNRAADATRILADRKQNLGLLAEILIARLQYKDALDLIGAGDAELAARERLEFDLRRARVLMLTGRRDDGVQLFGTVAERLRLTGDDGRRNPEAPITAVRSLIRAELRAGLRDLAAEHAGLFLTGGTFRRFEMAGTGESAFELLFGQDATAGESIFWALREKKIPGDEPGPTLARTRDLLAGKAGKAAVDEALAAIREAAEVAAPPPPSSVRPDPAAQEEAKKSRRFLATAAVCRAANRDAEAEVAFKAAAELTSDAADPAGARSWVFGTSDAYRPYVEWGDFLYDRGRFRDAADTFLAGWKKFPDQPILIFLSGRAMEKAGNAQEGARRVGLSHWVSLGQERVRGRFLDELVRRGEGKAAKRETELLLGACWPRDYYYGNVINQAARASVLNRDFATAEKCAQRSILILLKTPGMYYVETGAYMSVPHDMLTYRARARLAAGKVDEAVALAREVLAVTPGHVDLVSGMVPELEKRGKKAEADELFGTAWAAHEKTLAAFPDSPSARMSLALLAANCRRELDKGLTHARAAVKADPASVGYREALAEVLFRKGDREKAVEVMTTLVGDEPRNRFYQRQIARYRAGPFDGPRPDRADE